MARKWWTLLAVCLGMLMLLLDITIVNVALPSIADDLDASFSDLQWTIDAYALSLAALMLVAGSVGVLAALRPGAGSPVPQRQPRGAGHRRRGDVRDLAGAHRPGVQRP